MVGDPSHVGGLLSGARSVYEYYGNRRSNSFAPGGVRDYSAPILPVGPTAVEPGLGATAAVLAREVLSAIPRATADRGGVLSDAEGSTPTSVTDIDEPQPDPESIYANLPPLNPEWQDVDVFGTEEPEPTFEEDSPPAFIPVTAGIGQPDPLEPTTRQEPVEDEDMPSFWDYASGVVDVFQGQPVGGVQQPFAGPLPPAVPAPSGYTYNRAGQLCRKRRRRRRLLTESDFNDLMRIATLPNKQNVTVALAKAVGRR